MCKPIWLKPFTFYFCQRYFKFFFVSPFHGSEHSHEYFFFFAPRFGLFDACIPILICGFIPTALSFLHSEKKVRTTKDSRKLDLKMGSCLNLNIVYSTEVLFLSYQHTNIPRQGACLYRILDY